MTAPVPGIPQITEAQIVAARLRRMAADLRRYQAASPRSAWILKMAADLVLEAEVLEATAPRKGLNNKPPLSIRELAKQQGMWT